MKSNKIFIYPKKPQDLRKAIYLSIIINKYFDKKICLNCGKKVETPIAWKNSMPICIECFYKINCEVEKIIV